eukprot:6118-Heterococcus_DN1.PRE.4
MVALLLASYAMLQHRVLKPRTRRDYRLHAVLRCDRSTLERAVVLHNTAYAVMSRLASCSTVLCTTSLRLHVA